MGAGAGAGTGGASSGTALVLLNERLLRRLPNKLRLLLASDFVDAVSESSFESFLSALKAPLKLRLEDKLRVFPDESLGILNAKLESVGRLDCRSLGFGSEPVALGPLIADSASACESPVYAASTDAVLINGEDEV